MDRIKFVLLFFLTIMFFSVTFIFIEKSSLKAKIKHPIKKNNHSLYMGNKLCKNQFLPNNQPFAQRLHTCEHNNILKNGSFEDGNYSPDDWIQNAWILSNSIFTWDSTYAFDGKKSIKIENIEKNDAYWIQYVDVKPNTEYQLSGWLKTDSVDQTVSIGANLSLFGTWKNEGIVGTNDWTFISLNFKTDLDTQVTISARLGYWSNTTTGAVWFDDLKLIEVPKDSINNLRIELDNLELYEGWQWKHSKVIATTVDGSEVLIPLEDAIWSSSDSTVASVNDSGIIIAHNAGDAIITSKYMEYEDYINLKIIRIIQQPVIEEIDSLLATPAEGYFKNVPIVILRFLPTTDGINLDTKYAPGYWGLDQTSLSIVKSKIDKMDRSTKFMFEERSKFRGYKDSSALPTLGYNVIKYITIFEQVPPGEILEYEQGYPLYWPDYHQIFNRFNIEHMVNNLGVKEIWIWLSQLRPGFPSYDPSIHRPENFRAAPETNMSSALTGDISNSYRTETDLPIYNSTYTVFDRNTQRRDESVALALEVHGHQVEHLLQFINIRQDGNDDLFWKKFVGQNKLGNFSTGRCGWTHMPPNTTVDYDWQNLTLVWSDIEDWTPYKTGDTIQVNVDTWNNLQYSWPDGRPDDYISTRSQWFVYWMQNMPGYGNTIDYNGMQMTNWWLFTADWDSAISSNIGLYENKIENVSPKIVNLKDFTFFSNQECVIDLDTCVIDQDHSVTSLTWHIVSSDTNLKIDIQDHKTIFFTRSWEGESQISFKVVDPESAGDSIVVTAIVNNPTSIELAQATVMKTFLGQNFPNPFNPSTIIKYFIPNAGTENFQSVQLFIYDIIGREVATLVNEKQKPGYYEVEWNAGDRPSGIYFYKLQAGDFIKTKKMVLLR